MEQWRWNALEDLLAIGAVGLSVAAATALFYFLAGKRIARANPAFGRVVTRWVIPTSILILGLSWIFIAPPSDLKGWAVMTVLLAALVANPIAKITTEKLFQRYDRSGG
ncbi:hypothetical protein DM806_19190 [Sphingobium lactosutens]|uniref:hypothetical protein n=1 Tax=Sphingobium lactosutens TaxID=522773 RepID=UPI0015BADA53|nr:hypothetical protein [Sphingobium lactosutens]NWK97741.1 hypothetical protein [Sphingobium lactosutens]